MSLLQKINRTLGLDSPSQPAQGHDAGLMELVQDFRKERAEQFSKLIERNSTSKAEMVVLREELQDWRDYARRLERICLAAGLELPAAPDE